MKRNGQKVASLLVIADKQRWRSITNDFQERNRDGGMNRAEVWGETNASWNSQMIRKLYASLGFLPFLGYREPESIIRIL